MMCILGDRAKHGVHLVNFKNCVLAFSKINLGPISKVNCVISCHG